MVDLPLGIAPVWQKIKEMKINPSNATSQQQKSYLLLYNMVNPSVRDTMKEPPKPLPGREIQCPGRDFLANEARVLVWKRMQEEIEKESRRPHVYEKHALRDLWVPRRQVWII